MQFYMFDIEIGSNQIMLVEEMDLKLNTRHISVVTMEEIYVTQVTRFLRNVFILDLCNTFYRQTSDDCWRQI